MSVHENTINKLFIPPESVLDEVSQFIDQIWSKKLTEVGKQALADYKDDKEHTAFTALDGELFYELPDD
jgi:hypothetical protein